MGEGEDSVPDTVANIDVEHPVLGGDEGEVDHLDRRPEKVVIQVHHWELVFEVLQAGCGSLALKDGHPKEEGGVDEHGEDGLIKENFLCCALQRCSRDAFLEAHIEEVPWGAMEETNRQHPRAPRDVVASFLMHTPVQLNGLLDGVPNEEEYATGCHIRFQKIFRFVGRLEKSA